METKELCFENRPDLVKVYIIASMIEALKDPDSAVFDQARINVKIAGTFFLQKVAQRLEGVIVGNVQGNVVGNNAADTGLMLVVNALIPLLRSSE